MSPASTRKRIDSRDPFAIVLRAGHAAPVVLQSAQDADGATIAFHAEKQRLTQLRVAGDLLLVQQQTARTLLREPLREPRRPGSSKGGTTECIQHPAGSVSEPPPRVGSQLER